MDDLTLMRPPTPPGVQDNLDLGRWLGRREAFGLVAGRCSAADVECMRRIRDEQLYLGRAATWAEFCETGLHMGKSNANRLIALLEDYGPQYFYVSQLTRVSAASSRAIAPAVRENGIEYEGELIPFAEENSGRIAAAVSALAAAARTKPEQNLNTRVAALDAAGDRLLQQFRDLWQLCGGSARQVADLAKSLEQKVARMRTEIR
jgi:hypothetical protein